MSANTNLKRRARSIQAEQGINYTQAVELAKVMPEARDLVSVTIPWHDEEADGDHTDPQFLKEISDGVAEFYPEMVGSVVVAAVLDPDSEEGKKVLVGDSHAITLLFSSREAAIQFFMKFHGEDRDGAIECVSNFYGVELA